MAGLVVRGHHHEQRPSDFQELPIVLNSGNGVEDVLEGSDIYHKIKVALPFIRDQCSEIVNLACFERIPLVSPASGPSSEERFSRERNCQRLEAPVVAAPHLFSRTEA